MKVKSLLFTLILFSTIPSLGQESINNALNNFPVLKKDTVIPIMILGTFHFNFSENISDVKGENNFDIYAEKRQKELLILIEKIKNLNLQRLPLKICCQVNHIWTLCSNHIQRVIGL